MSSSKGLLLIAAIGVGGAALFLHSKKASAATQFPPGWIPPAGAVTQIVPPGNIPFTVQRTNWRQEANAGGLQPGNYLMLQSSTNPVNDYAVIVVPDATGQGQPLAMGTTQNSGLLAQAGVAGL